MQSGSILAVLAIATSIAAIYFPLRFSIRKDRRDQLRQVEEDREKAQRQAIADAERPLRQKISELQASETLMVENAVQAWRDRVADRDREIAAMTADRNYYRDLWNDRTDAPVSLVRPEKNTQSENT